MHLNDVSLISPVFVEGELLGYVANLAHHVDVGGGAPASIGAFQEVFQEGVIIPPVRLVAGGAIVDDVFQLILAQIRSKHETAGDFRAQIAANATGVRRVQALVARHGRETHPRHDERAARVHRAAHPRRDRGARPRRVRGGGRRRQRRLHGRARCACRCASRSAPTASSFDTSGSDPQRRAPVNSTYAMTFSACAYALKCLVDPDLPVNDGFYRLVHLDAPEGSVTNCTWPARGRRRLGDADAARRGHVPCAPAGVPGTAPRRHEGNDVPGRLRLARRRGRHATPASTTPSPEGYGGRFASDGPDAVQAHGQNTENAPIEETELNYPVMIDRLALVEDSDGPGPLPRRPRTAQGLPVRPADDVHDPRRPRPLRALGRRRGWQRPDRRIPAAPGRRRDEARLEEHGRPRLRRRDQRPQLRRRWLRAAERARACARAP